MMSMAGSEAFDPFYFGKTESTSKHLDLPFTFSFKLREEIEIKIHIT